MKKRWMVVLPWLFIAIAVVTLMVGRSRPWGPTFSLMFVSIVLEALPFVMLGSLIGGLIEVFLSREAVSGLFAGRSARMAPLAALMGLVFPVCECAVIPVTRRLIRKGVPFSVAVAYLLAGPIVNPLVGLSTAVAFKWDWEIVAVRLVGGYVIAVIIAVVFDRIYPGHSAVAMGGDAEQPQMVQLQAQPGSLLAAPASGHGQVHKASIGARLLDAFGHAAQDFMYVGQFLIVGAFFAGVSQTMVDRKDFLELASTPGLAIGLMMGLAILLNLCSEADAFVGASFRGTMPLPAILAFLILGPMLDIKLMAMYLTFIKKKALLLLVALMVSLVFFAMLGWQLWNGGLLP